jgi:ATP-dependent DNA helicase RecQ
MDLLHKTLHDHWRFDSFKPMQEEIIRSVLAGKDTLAILPTGGGKSLCFQVPGMIREGLCLVISPLIALMKDQVENLRKKNITAFAIYSGMEKREVENCFGLAAESNCKFLYISPERIETKLFKEWLPALDIRLIAVDEAHCISQWGYDFRPPYLRIAALREELPRVPIIALTASATREVQADICEKLNFSNPGIFRQSFSRPNLSYSAFHVESKINKIVEILKNVNGSAIIYCQTRRKTKSIRDLLAMHGVSAEIYHAGLKQEERNQRQEDWKMNRIRVIVCTNAFGMGIDKPDVRSVIHADIPDCLENYYQEAGRAGRDGLRAYAVLLHAGKDFQEIESLPDQRFPSAEKIKKTYRALVNFLQLPAGTGESTYFDFDFKVFTKQFSLDPIEAVYSLKALEQEGILAFNEQVFLPAKIGFICGREALEEIDKTTPSLTLLIQTLLRTYSGIFDQPVPVSEKFLARSLKKNLQELNSELEILCGRRIIEYFPQKDSPQIYFLQDRINTSDLKLENQRYGKRRKNFEHRILALLSYVNSESGCRQVLLNDYFGEKNTADCGICDHCLKNKKRRLSSDEFESVYKLIKDKLILSPSKPEDLQKNFSNISREKFWEIFHYLEAENKLSVGEDGLVKSMN